jgi:hypothetical protein
MATMFTILFGIYLSTVAGLARDRFHCRLTVACRRLKEYRNELFFLD